MSRLPRVQKKCKCSLGAEQKGGQRWHSALEVGDGAALQTLAQLADTLGSVGAHESTKITILQVDAAEPILGEAVGRVQEMCKMSRGGEQKAGLFGFEGRLT